MSAIACNLMPPESSKTTQRLLALKQASFHKELPK